MPAMPLWLRLQHDCPVDTLHKALTRNSDGSTSGPLARALDLLAQPRTGRLSFRLGLSMPWCAVGLGLATAVNELSEPK
jgi:hypothetical protein